MTTLATPHPVHTPTATGIVTSAGTGTATTSTVSGAGDGHRAVRHMTGHVTAGRPAAGGPRPGRSPSGPGLWGSARSGRSLAGWARFSRALAVQAATIADRDDLSVMVAPGAGQGSPACFLPDLSLIEVDGTHLGRVSPGRAKPHRVADRARYPVVWGLLVHECAHSRHSLWRRPGVLPAGVLNMVEQAAMLLEESRIESRHLARRPQDLAWLRASTRALILADLPAALTPATSTATPTGPPVPSPVPPPVVASPSQRRWMAATAAGLLLARHEIGILTDHEITPVRAAVEAILGADTHARLRELWRLAHGVDDTDTTAMLDLGRRWLDVLGIDPHGDPATGTGTESGTGSASGIGTGTAADSAPSTGPDDRDEDGRDGDGGAVAALAGAIEAGLGRLDRAVARDMDAVLAGERRAQDRDRAAERAATEREQLAGRVFDPDLTNNRPSTARSRVSGTRAPRPAERTAARALARGLDDAGLRDRAISVHTSAVPPGRLRMRGALSADAQRAAGAAPTARPFSRKTRRVIPAPPLRVGIGCDISGSMASVTAEVASAAWLFAEAAAHTTTDLTTATVIFGRDVHAVTRPGQRPREVAEFCARDLWEAADTAIDALDGALGLSRPGNGARLLVIISDGRWRAVPRQAAQQRTTRLRAAGCGVLWLAPRLSTATPLDGVTAYELSDPSATARTIATAATRALRTT